jgi:SAM-dependent methyltransferase
MNSRELEGKKFGTQNSDLFQIWDEVQRVQADFCFPQEISAYYMSENWIKSAKKILDVGTGNGYFLNMISAAFPEKLYTAIDISNEFIEKAKQDQKNSKITYRVQDYFDVESQFDFIIMRLFWQHLPLGRFKEAFLRLEKLTKIGSSVLITDAWDSARHFQPDLPEFRKIISAYTEQQIATGRDRNILERLLLEVTEEKIWELGIDLKYIIPSTIGSNLKLFYRVYDLWIKLFECLGELKVNYSPAKEELKNWIRESSNYTQAGLRVIRLDRVK